MKWNHLPNTGGLYDQHPKLLDDFQVLMHLENENLRREHEKQRRQTKAKR